MDDDRGPRTLRFWALADAIYSALVITLVSVFVPWKWPVANALVVTYAAAIGAGAWALGHARHWAWRLAVTTSLVGLAGAVVVVGGLVASWAFLRASYGAFGAGASVVSLLIAASVFQVLGLYPALRLRALLRRELRERFGAGQAAATAALALCMLPWPAGLYVQTHYALSPVSPLSVDAGREALRVARRALDGQSALPTTSAVLSRVPLGPGPLYLTLFAGGQPIARVSAAGSDLGAAVAAASAKLAARPEVRGHETGRLKLDRPVAVGPVPEWPPFLLAMAIDPGRDGLRTVGGDADALLPDDVLAADVYGAAPLLPALDEVRLGVNADWLRARVPAPPGRPRERFRVESWMECGAGACAIDRGVALGASFDVKAAAIATGDFVLRQLRSDGTFNYVYWPYSNTAPPSGYNLARHAGTTYSLGLLYGLTGEARFLEGAKRAVDWLRANVAEPCVANADFGCIVWGGEAAVGENALALLAVLQIGRHRSDPDLARLAQRLGGFLMHMQKKNGDFHHVFNRTNGGIDPHQHALMFASEEAALALVEAGKSLRDLHARAAAEAALDFLTGEKYDFFLGQFTYGVDSWTCMAAAAAWPELKKPHYADFCLGYAAFLRRIQFTPGEGGAPDFAGHYGFSHVLIPQAPAAAGFTEALTAVYDLARRHDRTREARTVQEQIEVALRALVRDQIGPDNDYLVRDPAFARGGIRRSLVQSDVRIDFAQHALGAFVRAAQLGLGR